MTKSLSSEVFISYLKLAAMSFFFSGVFIAGRAIAGDVEPAMAAFLRFVIATAVLLMLLLSKERRLPVPTPRQFMGLIALGLTGVFGYNLCLLSGLETVSSSRSSVIVATNPVFISLLSVMFPGDHLTRRKVAGIALSVIGAMFVASRGSLDNIIDFSPGDMAIVICAICWASYSVIGKYVLNTLSPLVSVTYASILGLLMLLPVNMLQGNFQAIHTFSATVWLAIFYMAIFGTVCAFLLYYQGIKTLGVVRAGTFINLIPVSTIILALFILNEDIDASILIGTVLTLTGIFLVNSQQKPAIGTNS